MILSFLIALLSRRDWVYSLSLLVPLVAYDLGLKTYDLVASQSFGDAGLTRVFYLMQSNIFFTLGYSLLWIGLFAVARRKLQHWTVVVLFHVSTILLIILNTCAHWHFQETGTRSITAPSPSGSPSSGRSCRSSTTGHRSRPGHYSSPLSCTRFLGPLF